MMWGDLSWLWGPLLYPTVAGKRLYYVFIASSLAIVLIRALMKSSKLETLRRDIKLAFSWKIWSHRSSRVDIMWLFFNNWLYLLLFAPLIWSVTDVLIWSAHGLDLLFEAKGVLNHWPQWLVTVLYTLTLFLCGDLSRFILHYALHRIPWLWRFHKVHHSAEVLTPITVYRAHPVEMLLYKLRGLLVIGLVSGLFYFLFLGKMKVWAIVGINGLGFLFNFFGSNLRHSQIWLGFGRFERFFISPAQHQMHHCKDLSLATKNIGSCLALWDRWFGTWRCSDAVPDDKRTDYGVEEKRLNHKSTSWFSSLLKPFYRA